MKLEEVLPFLRQGRRIKRKMWSNFSSLESLNQSSTVIEGVGIGAGDWEVEPITKEITLEQLKAAWIAASMIRPELSFVFEQMASRLGFTVD